MNKLFNLDNISIERLKTENPQTLAFVGDAVYTLFVRELLVNKKDEKIKDLHCDTSSFVKAESQSLAVEKILPLLNESELAIFKRGRNFKTNNIAKNASAISYRRATGFEAVIGYLYLSNNFEKLNQILNAVMGDEK